MNRRSQPRTLQLAVHSQSGQCSICGNALNPLCYTHTAAERLELFVQYGILVLPNSGHCTNCAQNINSVLDIAQQMPLRNPTPLDSFDSYNRTLYYIMKSHRSLLLETERLRSDSTLRISLSTLTDEEVPNWCKISRTNLQDLSTTFDVDINKLFFFYTKCYRNDPLRFLMSIFRKDYTTLSRWFNDVLDALTADDSLVSQHLNDSWTRSKVDQHTPDYIKDLYDRDANRLIFMTDGTLIQIQKPQHFNRQKKSWADRKSMNSLNFMPIMALDGSYIINIGPFYGGGDNSDEFVFKAAINSEYREWCRNNQGHDDCMFDIPMLDQLDDFFENTFDEDVDNMIGDRGYGQPGDRSKALECPDNLNPKKKRGVPSGPARKQLPTNEANRTRKVTYIRHTAERKYSQSKTFRIVGTIVLQQFCRRIKDILDVLFATMNRCLPALISHSEKRQRFAQRILDHQQYKKSEVGHYIAQTFAIRNLKVVFFRWK